MQPSEHPEASREGELAERARLLRDAPLFVGVTDDAMSEKRSILLVLAGLKPVAEVASGHWVPTVTGRRTVADDPEQVGKFLESLGLAYHLRTDDDHRTNAVVALTPELVKQYESAESAADVGRLFGYPETAIRAFETRDLLTSEEQEIVERGANLNESGVPFRLSRDHWQEEIEVVKRWSTAAREYGFGPQQSMS